MNPLTWLNCISVMSNDRLKELGKVNDEKIIITKAFSLLSNNLVNQFLKLVDENKNTVGIEVFIYFFKGFYKNIISNE